MTQGENVNRCPRKKTKKEKFPIKRLGENKKRKFSIKDWEKAKERKEKMNRDWEWKKKKRLGIISFIFTRLMMVCAIISINSYFKTHFMFWSFINFMFSFFLMKLTKCFSATYDSAQYSESQLYYFWLHSPNVQALHNMSIDHQPCKQKTIEIKQ